MPRVIFLGGSSALGEAFATKLLADGWEVVDFSYNAPRDKRIRHTTVDLSAEAGVQLVVETILRDFGRFDLFVSCAGILSQRALRDVTYQDVHETLAVNTVAPLAIIAQLADRIRLNGADIVSVGSSMAYKTEKNHLAYTVSKWGIRGMNEALRLNFQGSGVRVIGVNPAGFKSPLHARISGDMSIGRDFMEPADIAEAMYLAVMLPKSVEIGEVVLNNKELKAE